MRNGIFIEHSHFAQKPSLPSVTMALTNLTRAKPSDDFVTGEVRGAQKRRVGTSSGPFPSVITTADGLALSIPTEDGMQLAFSCLDEVRFHSRNRGEWNRRLKPMLHFSVILLLIFLLIGTIPAWPYSRSWGYYPSSMVVALLSIVLILTLSGRF
jgi:hypothetical protein